MIWKPAMRLNDKKWMALVLIAILSTGLICAYAQETAWMMRWACLASLVLIPAVFISRIYQYQAMLEQMVRERTAALQESQEKYRKIYENIQDVYFEVASDGTILEVGKRIEELSKGQYKKEDLLGRKFMELLSDPEQTVAPMWRTLKEYGSIDNWEIRYKNRDGTLTTCAISAIIEADIGEKSFKIIGTLYDITDRKRAEQRIQTLSRAVEQSPVSIVITDPAGKIEYVNQKFEMVSGYTQAEALGQNPRVLKSGHQSDELYQELWKIIASGHEWRGELCNQRKNGETYWERVSISPIRDDSGQTIHYLAIKEDITDRKSMEEQLQRRTEEAQAASLAKSQFLANVGHEVRTPLNGVLGMIGLLSDTELSAVQRRYIEVARASGEILLGLLNNILDFSRAEADQLELEMLDFNLRATLEDIAETLAPRAHEKNLKLTCHLAPNLHASVRGDPGRLRQILMALGGNAIKFTARGEVVIEASVASETDQQIKVQFDLCDTGIGIPQDQLNLLFNSFQQMDASTTRRFGGVGLGLALAKRLVQKMGGEINVTSIADQGSRFWFTAIFNKQIDPARPDEAPTADLRGVRALVVDDKPSHRLILTEQLALWRLRYEETGSGQQALTLLREAQAAGDPFHLLITDMQIPDRDGVALGAAIKADPELRNTVLVMLTSIGQRGDAKKLQDIGFAAYLTKPAPPDQLHDCLVKVMGYAQADGQAPVPLVTRHTLREARCQPVTVLVVEDNQINQIIVLKILEKLGYRADAVASGQEALEALQNRPCDLVLMDVEMPDMDGLEATRRIRSGQVGDAIVQIPIIAMTAHTAREDRENCLQAGMNDHISKPVNRKVLSQILERWRPAPSHTLAATPPTDDQTVLNVDGLWPEMPGLDVRRGLLRIGGDRNLYQRLLDRFVETQSGTATALRKAVMDSDLALARRLAHNIKGVAGNLGASELEAAARKLEQALSDAQLPGIENFLADFEQSLTRLIDHLQNLPGLKPEPGPLSNAAGSPEALATPAELRVALDELAPHLKTRKPKYCAEALRGIESLIWPAHLQAEMNQMAGLVRKYRFPESLALLESIQRNLSSIENTR